ncbi:MAG TPA: SGNH/GDSL hydrolase family protein [Lacunisphaera sp.]
MRFACLLLPLTALTMVASETREQVIAERAESHAKNPERYQPVPDDPALPRVLLIGDSITHGYSPAVRTALKGMANVHLIPDNGGPTDRGLLMLDEWLGLRRWDLIHFNFGLHDIKLRDDAQIRNTPETYRRNLHALARRLHATGARLVFATSTPVPGTLKKSGPRRRTADMIAYNAIAREVMEEEAIPLNDLYALALPRVEELQLPSDVHFSDNGYRALGTAVAESIRAQLAAQPARSP